MQMKIKVSWSNFTNIKQKILQGETVKTTKEFTM